MDSINELLWKHYFQQFETRFINYGSSERSRAIKLFDAIESQNDNRLEGSEVLEILDESDQEEYEMDARYLRSCLHGDSFIKIFKGDISYSSGLIPAWRKVS